MALVPLFACGWANGILEGNAAGGGTLPIASAVKAHTGANSIAFVNATYPYGRTVANKTELRAAAVFNHNGVSAAVARGCFFCLVAADATHFVVEWEIDGLLRMRSGAGSLTTIEEVAIAGTGLSVSDTWLNCSVAMKIHSSSGFFVFYNAAGEETLSFVGNTGSSPITAVMVGGRTPIGSNNGWASTLYVDDFYAVDSTGEAAGPLSNRRFLWGQASGNGQSSQWTGSDGNTTDNYLLVDDGATVDSDTTYVKAESAGLVDYYDHAAITVPTDWRPVRVWPTAIAKKTDAGVATTLELGLWKASTDDSSAPIALPTSYGMVQAYFDDLPDGSDIADQGNINALEIRVESAGAYS